MIKNQNNNNTTAVARRRRKSKKNKSDLEQNVRSLGGRTGYILEDHSLRGSSDGGTFSKIMATPTTSSTLKKKKYPRNNSNNNPLSTTTTTTPFSLSSKTTTTTSRKNYYSKEQKNNAARVYSHLVCAISENLARETCIALIDAASPIELMVSKQANGQTYAETLTQLEMLHPHEVLLNEGRQNSQLAQKVVDLYTLNNICGGQSVADSSSLLTSSHNTTTSTTTKGGADGLKSECQPNTVVKFVPRNHFDQTKGGELLRRVAREGSYDPSIVDEYIISASAHAVLHYTQICLGATFTKHTLHLNISSGGRGRMMIDRNTLLNLELLANAKTGKHHNSLIGTIDYTKTNLGSRLLRTSIMAPSVSVPTIKARQHTVETLLEDEDFFYGVLEHLEALPEVDKMLAHIALTPRGIERDTINPRIASRGISALVCIKSTLSVIPSFSRLVSAHLDSLVEKEGIADAMSSIEHSQDHASNDISEDCVSLSHDSMSLTTDNSVESTLLPSIAGKYQLLRAILLTMQQPSLSEVLLAVQDIFTESTTFTRNSHAMRHQECFALKPNTDGMMDVLRKAFLANVDDIYRLADEYAENYNISVTVKEKSSRGYYLSIPSTFAQELPEIFIQPVKSGRYIHCTTEEIYSLNSRAQENVQDLLLMTHERIQTVIDFARSHYDAIASLCDAIALLDMLHSFADVVTSSRLPWCRPLVSENDGTIAIRNGRYVIDVSGPKCIESREFVPNDTYAGPLQNFTMVTGVNGSGKSTYLKQVAICIVLAQCGCFVPAEEAFIPVRDKICTRIGTCDDQEHNISTFMQEMKETSSICNQCTNKSLILIDELGRATSNEDGIAIAWAVSEFLLVKKAITFFVTHYSQLTKLADVYSNVNNQHLGSIISEANEIRYTHKVMPGPCTMGSDYGVEMAATCGWPLDVLREARTLRLELDGKLPDETVCRAPNMDLMGTRNKAEKALVEVAKHLVALKEAAGRLTMEAKRAYLEDITSQLVAMRDPNVLDMMMSITASSNTATVQKTDDTNDNDIDGKFQAIPQSNTWRTTMMKRNSHENVSSSEEKNKSNTTITKTAMVTSSSKQTLRPKNLFLKAAKERDIHVYFSKSLPPAPLNLVKDPNKKVIEENSTHSNVNKKPVSRLRDLFASPKKPAVTAKLGGQTLIDVSEKANSAIGKSATKQLGINIDVGDTSDSLKMTTNTTELGVHSLIRDVAAEKALSETEKLGTNESSERIDIGGINEPPKKYNVVPKLDVQVVAKDAVTVQNPSDAGKRDANELNICIDTVDANELITDGETVSPFLDKRKRSSSSEVKKLTSKVQARLGALTLQKGMKGEIFFESGDNSWYEGVIYSVRSCGKTCTFRYDVDGSISKGVKATELRGLYHSRDAKQNPKVYVGMSSMCRRPIADDDTLVLDRNYLLGYVTKCGPSSSISFQPDEHNAPVINTTISDLLFFHVPPMQGKECNTTGLECKDKMANGKSASKSLKPDDDESILSTISARESSDSNETESSSKSTENMETETLKTNDTPTDVNDRGRDQRLSPSSLFLPTANAGGVNKPTTNKYSAPQEETKFDTAEDGYLATSADTPTDSDPESSDESESSTSCWSSDMPRESSTVYKNGLEKCSPARKVVDVLSSEITPLRKNFEHTDKFSNEKTREKTSALKKSSENDSLLGYMNGSEMKEKQSRLSMLSPEEFPLSQSDLLNSVGMENLKKVETEKESMSPRGKKLFREEIVDPSDIFHQSRNGHTCSLIDAAVIIGKSSCNEGLCTSVEDGNSALVVGSEVSISSENGQKLSQEDTIKLKADSDQTRSAQENFSMNTVIVDSESSDDEILSFAVFSSNDSRKTTKRKVLNDGEDNSSSSSSSSSSSNILKRQKTKRRKKPIDLAKLLESSDDDSSVEESSPSRNSTSSKHNDNMKKPPKTPDSFDVVESEDEDGVIINHSKIEEKKSSEMQIEDDNSPSSEGTIEPSFSAEKLFEDYSPELNGDSLKTARSSPMGNYKEVRQNHSTPKQNEEEERVPTSLDRAIAGIMDTLENVNDEDSSDNDGL